jgi:hypothetical protein
VDERDVAQQHEGRTGGERHAYSGRHRPVDAVRSPVRVGSCPWTAEPLEVANRHRRRDDQVGIAGDGLGDGSRRPRLRELVETTQDVDDHLIGDAVGGPPRLGPRSVALRHQRCSVEQVPDRHDRCDVSLGVDHAGPADLDEHATGGGRPRCPLCQPPSTQPVDRSGRSHREDDRRRTVRCAAAHRRSRWLPEALASVRPDPRRRASPCTPTGRTPVPRSPRCAHRRGSRRDRPRMMGRHPVAGHPPPSR